MTPRQELVAKATEDPEFRQQLKADPRATVAQEFGTQIPDDFEITVLEETPQHAYIVLPAQASELSAEQLDAVSGGQIPIGTPIALLLVGAEAEG